MKRGQQRTAASIAAWRTRSWARTARRLLGLIVVAAAAGCGDDPLGPDPEDVAFHPSLQVNLATMTKLPSGVYIQTLTPGTGTATVAPTSFITIAYRGWLADGTQFDSSDSLSGLRANQYVPGFTDGVLGMKVGEKRKLVIPSALGYGEQGAGDDIPGDAVLIFDVTLLSIP